jgi:hypothetical protein
VTCDVYLAQAICAHYLSSTDAVLNAPSLGGYRSHSMVCIMRFGSGKLCALLLLIALNKWRCLSWSDEGQQFHLGRVASKTCYNTMISRIFNVNPGVYSRYSLLVGSRDSSANIGSLPRRSTNAPSLLSLSRAETPTACQT